MTAYQNFSLDKNSRDKLIGSGWSKHVYKAGEEMALKKLNVKGVSLDKCHQKGDWPSSADSKCVEDVASGFIKEIGFLLRLQGDPNVPRLLAYCIPQDFSYNLHQLITLVSRASTPLDMVYLLQNTWRRRLLITSQILDFMHRIWPVQLHDFRRQQFVLSSQGTPIYVDFDDASEANKCGFVDTIHCFTSFDQDLDYSRKIASRTYEDFSKDLFWIGAPKQAIEWLKQLQFHYTNNSLDVSQFQKIEKKLLEL